MFNCRVASRWRCLLLVLCVFLFMYIYLKPQPGSKRLRWTSWCPTPPLTLLLLNLHTHTQRCAQLSAVCADIPSLAVTHSQSILFSFSLSLVHWGRKREILSHKCYTWATVCSTGKRLNVAPNAAPLADNAGNIYPRLRSTQQPPVTCKSHYSPEANWFRVWRSTPSHGAQRILEILACTF